jgi:hypothetical protein
MKRLFIIGVFFALAVTITAAGTIAPLSSSDEAVLKQELDKTRQNISVQVIFGNNLMICLIMFVPVVGPAFGSIVLFDSGLAIQAEVTLDANASAPNVPPVLVLLASFILPHTVLEFISYSSALAESAWLTGYIIKRRNRRRELVRMCVFISICAVLLLAGAAIEYALIQAFPVT